MASKRLTDGEMLALGHHYTGNCTGYQCERCRFYLDIDSGVPGAVEAYVRFVREQDGRAVQTIDADGD